MRKIFFKTISLTIVLSFLFVFSFNSFSIAQANQDRILEFKNPVTNDITNYEILIDNPGIRKIRVWDDNSNITVTYNKKTEVFTVEENGQLETYQLDLNNSKAIESSSSNIASTTHVKIVPFMEKEFSYRVFLSVYPYQWRIYVDGRSKLAIEEGRNITELSNFKSAINQLSFASVELYSHLGSGAFSIAAALIALPEKWTTIVGLLLAAGLSISSSPDFYNMYHYMNEARYYWNRTTIAPPGGGGGGVSPFINN